MSPDSGHSGRSDELDFPGAGGESDYPDFHRSTRMPLDAVVRLHFEGTVAYQNGFGANVSATGMYVKHPDPPPLGTRLVFELVLGDDRKPVQGAGVVAWTREKYEGPGRPAGIGIQFTEVDPLSRQHIAEALFAYLEAQLGDELAENQDVADLVAASSSRTPIDVVASIGRPAESDGEVLPSITRAVGPPPAVALPQPESETEPAPFAFGPLEESVATGIRVTEGGLFTPEIPPDDLAEIRGAESRRTKSPWPAVAIGAAIAVAGFGAWWLLAGPGSVGEPAPVRSTARREPVVAPPPRPALDPKPGTATTLAQTVGAEKVSAPEPLPVDGGAPRPTPDAPTEAAPDAPTTASESNAAEPSPAAGAVAVASARATRVTSIEWEESSGLTVVVLTGDGGFPAGAFKWNEIRDANPRVLLRFNQMAAGYAQSVLAAGTPELRQVRVGFHEKPEGNELHVVLDLAAADVTVAGVEASGNRLSVRLTRP